MHLLTRCLLVSRPLDQFHTLLIDRSAELAESPLPVRGRPWRRSREHQAHNSLVLHPASTVVARNLCRRVLLSFSSALIAHSSPVCPRGSLQSFHLSILSFPCHTALPMMPAAPVYSSTATFLLAIVGRRDSRTCTSCSSGLAGV